MNYVADLKDYSNVTVSQYTPRKRGERIVISEWKDLDGRLPRTYRGRLAMIKALSASRMYAEVWFKTASNGGRAKVYVKYAAAAAE